jgi:hypothetical protein
MSTRQFNFNKQIDSENNVKPIAILCFGALLLTLPQTAAAQLFGGDSDRANIEFIPKSAFAGAVIFPAKISKDPKFDLFPREIVTAWGIKELGFDPMLIKQVTFLAQETNSLERPPQWAAILHFEKMQGLAGNLIDRLEQKQVAGKAMFSGTAMGLPSFLVYDEATLFVGDEGFFQEMVTANKSGPLVDLIKGSSLKGEIRAYGQFESVRPMLNQLTAGIPALLPPPITRLKQMPNLLDAIEVGVTVDGRVKTTLVLHASDDDTAENVSKILTEAMEFGSEMMLGMMAAQMDFNDPVQEATVEYAQRVAEDFKSKLTPEVSGNKLTMNLDEEATILPIAIGMLLPAVQQTRAAARRAQSMNNMRQMTLASLNYESAYGHFPTQASYDKNGKPLLSWRVHVLPYIDQNELYEQFHLDEPWDSPHNRKLIEKMPQAYASPSVGDLGGKTVYLGIAGEGMMFGKNKIGFGQITDGSSNTVLMVEADPSRAVEWTKPEDYEVDRRRPLDGLGGVQPGGFIVSFADGSSRFLRPNIDPKTWLNLLTIGDGNIVDFNDL